ncbi:hypothetical protein AB1L07_12010 [Niallia alba]|uniref:hypothetical protein n=1 Tax=Niallia alba TaxID=2729105 RepID=UPI0011AFBDB7
MSNKIKEEMDKIKIPKEIKEKSENGVYQAKMEMKKEKKAFHIKNIVVAAVILISIGTFTWFNNGTISNNMTEYIINNTNSSYTMENGAIQIPAIELPEDNTNADMIGLIMYDGKIYTQTDTEIDLTNASSIKGERLGKTKGTINEWSKQEDFAKEFASSVEEAEVFSVKGYDSNFRIMTFMKKNGEVNANFYENLNGITISNGNDVFGKLKMIGKVSRAQWRAYSDWDSEIENYHDLEDMTTLNTFIEELNTTTPLLRKQTSDPITSSRSDNLFRELIIYLNDGSKVKLTLLKEGYIYYGFMDVYFKMKPDVFTKLWEEIE